MIKIEKNIPLPSIGDAIASAMSKMAVGDSFLLGDADENSRATVYRKIRQFAPREFTTRAVEGGIRVWRVK